MTRGIITGQAGKLEGVAKITPAQPKTNQKKNEEKAPLILAPISLSCDCNLLEPPTLPDTIDTMAKIDKSSAFWEGDTWLVKSNEEMLGEMHQGNKPHASDLDNCFLQEATISLQKASFISNAI